jgi:hypothetical protein
MAGAWQALSVWGLMFIQLGYDSCEMGLTEAGHFISALKKFLARAFLHMELGDGVLASLFLPLWQAHAHWKRLEPYEFRLPVPERVALGLAGLAFRLGDWQLGAFILVSWHCLLRVQETFSL